MEYEEKKQGIVIEKDWTDSCRNCDDRPNRKLTMPWLRGLLKIQRRLVMRTCMLHFLKNSSREPIGYSTKISTSGVEWGRVDIWIVLQTSFEMV